MHLILLSGENSKLARLEAESLLRLENTRLSGSRLFCTIPTESMKAMNRLAYAKKAYEVLYTTDRKNLEQSLTEYPWMNYYGKSFCLRTTSKEHYDERYYAGFVWKNLEKSTRPKVDLDNPGLFIELFIDKDVATVTRMIYQNFETFEDRKAHMLPKLHPTTMHPKMARALVNILNPKDKVIDPFCGSCGILTEAALLGLRCEGYDINPQILDDAAKNMEYHDIPSRAYSLSVKDSTTLKDLKDVVTDLPYGKSSKKSHDLMELYSRFIATLSGRAVVVMPSFMPCKQILGKNLSRKLEVRTIIDQYIHKSLTRKIIVIDMKKARHVIVKTADKKVKRISKPLAKKNMRRINVRKISKKVIKPKKIISKNKAYKKSPKHHTVSKKKILRKDNKKI